MKTFKEAKKIELYTLAGVPQNHAPCYAHTRLGQIGTEMTRRVGYTKSLGPTIDDRLSWLMHVDGISKKAFPTSRAVVQEKFAAHAFPPQSLWEYIIKSL